MIIGFLSALFVMGILMKWMAWMVSGQDHSQGKNPYLWSPHPGNRPLPISLPPSISALSQRAILHGAILVLLYFLLLHGSPLLNAWTLGYAVAPVVLFLSEFLVTIAALVYLATDIQIGKLHRSPWAASSVADFWGTRWNLWFHDWFHLVHFVPLRRKPVLALFLVFFVSGLMHEWVINVPLYFTMGHAPFGWMTVYFMAQAIGILLERRFLRRWDLGRRLFAWLVVLGPAPLVFNEGMIRALQLWVY